MWAEAWREVVWNMGARGQVEVTCPVDRRSIRTCKSFCWSNKGLWSSVKARGFHFLAKEVCAQ